MQPVRWGIIGCGDVTEVKSGPGAGGFSPQAVPVRGAPAAAVSKQACGRGGERENRHHLPGIPAKVHFAGNRSLSFLTGERCAVLKNRNVTLYPDLGGYEKWKRPRSCKTLPSSQYQTLLERIATEEQSRKDLDLADLLLCSSFILTYQ